MNKNISLIGLLLILFSCQETPKKAVEQAESITTKDWKILSKKDSFDGWHIFQNESNNKSGWTVEDGVFTFDESNAKGEGNKSLLTDAVYSSFEIIFEWKLSANSNSGFMWGVSEDLQY